MAGVNVIVDRTNTTMMQRRTWIDIARQVDPHASVVSVFFQTPIVDCISRVRNRVGHPTLSGPESEGVIRSFARDFEHPRVSEGFDACLEFGDMPPDQSIFGLFEFFS